MKFDIQSLIQLIHDIGLEIEELKLKKKELEQQLQGQRLKPPPGTIKKALKKLGMLPKLTKAQRREHQRQISESQRSTITEYTSGPITQSIPQTA